MATQTITKEWKKTTIGKVYNFTSKPRGLDMPETVDFIPMEAVSERNEVIDKTLIKKVSKITSGTYVENGDFILAKITPSFENGKQGFVSINFPFAYATTEVIPIQEIEGLSDKQFLAYWLRQKKIRSVLAGKMEGTTGRQRLSKTILASTKIFFPPLLEQKAIAQTLTTVQDAIAEQENLITKLKELKKSMMQHLFTHGTTGEKTKMTEIGEIPENWEVGELINFCYKPQYGFTESASKSGNVKFLRITDITDNGVNWNTVPFCNCPEPEKYLLRDGDIVFARIGATTGKSFLLKNPDNAVYASYLIRVRAKSIDSSFLYHYFQTEAYWKQIDAQKGTNLKGGANGSILSKLLVPECNSSEQIRIANALNSIDGRIELSQAKLASYQNLFKTLLHELMSGERRIKNV